jgi:hypothetical protein
VSLGTLITHYLELALDRGGVRIDSDVRAELAAIAEELDRMALALTREREHYAREEARLDSLARLIDDSTVQLYAVISAIEARLERDQ